MLTLIEDGASWPEPALRATFPFFRKPDITVNEMGDYRTLTLTDPTYRTSAKTKCRELDPLLQIVGGMKASYQLLQATEQQMDIAIWHDGLRKQSYGCGHSGEVLPTYHNALIAY